MGLWGTLQSQHLWVFFPFGVVRFFREGFFQCHLFLLEVLGCDVGGESACSAVATSPPARTLAPLSRSHLFPSLCCGFQR